LEQVRHALLDHAPQRIRLLRQACARRREGSTQFLRAFLNDPDERIMRIAAREIARRRPPDCQNLLLQRMTDSPESVRRVIGRSLGESGFDHFWTRFDSLDRAARRQAGRAMFKLLPDASQRLARKLMSPTIGDCVRAMQIIHELKILDQFEPQVLQLMNHPNPKIRSKAISLLGDRPQAAPGVVLERALTDADPRVRANAIEVIDARGGDEFVPMLAARAREGTNRERANAIRALSRMRAGTAATQLLNMLKDPRGEHRISALWALREIGWWRLVKEVAQLAKVDDDLKVRRYAMGVLKSAIQAIQPEKAA
ncbi:MAG TPA: HEAT repeat domain-containing protein, partial [Tepidisphaeraceae bacterium]|nr:HEAT repeat domain-containing protein [Tepidisphaeraceae bacterium]